jgi:hypothetical protein
MESVISLFIPIFFMACVAACIMAPGYFRQRDRAQMQQTLRTALEKGQTLPTELVTALQSDMSANAIPTPERDLRRGIVLIAVALGFCILGYGLWFGLMSVDDTAAYITGGSTAGFGAIPGLIGVAYLILWATKRSTRRV